MGRIYQQTFVDTYSCVALCKLYTEKSAITAVDMLNDQVLPFFAQQDIPLWRVLTDRGNGILWEGGEPRLPALSGRGKYRPQQNQGTASTDQRHL